MRITKPYLSHEFEFWKGEAAEDSALNHGQELVEINKSDKVANKVYLVVDVRDDDYAGGNIKHALNRPSREFHMGVYDLVQKTADVKVMVFHCALSQMRCVPAEDYYCRARSKLYWGTRGPKAARVNSFYLSPRLTFGVTRTM
jgi:hypothetical protein